MATYGARLEAAARVLEFLGEWEALRHPQEIYGIHTTGETHWLLADDIRLLAMEVAQ